MRKNAAANFDNPQKILVFDRYKILIAVISSYHACERLTGIKHPMVREVVVGKSVSSKSFYFRALAEDITIEDSDIGTLSLLEYDKDGLNQDRKVYPNGAMRGRPILESQMHGNRYKFVPKRDRNGRIIK